MIGLLLLIIASKCEHVVAQDTTRSAIALPIAFYLPETRWGFGAAGIINFNIQPQDTIAPPSQIQLGGAYTQEKQILAYLNYNLFWDQRKWNVSGELG
ncbi:MAG: hypothetical protein HKN32_00975, partial [Flavobacteriales bacterium]|nr:hypothetical protein [Flavobacteriales bacterium]